VRLAFFSPLPPAATGIADYTIDVLGELRSRATIEVFHDQETVDTARLPSGITAHPAAEFDARHEARPYDLNVYQMGNGTAHAFVYPFLFRVPGLLVLHDLVLHHSRAKMFLDSAEARAYAADPASAERRAAALARVAEYRAELEYSYPGRGERIADAQLGTVGPLLPYAFPLFRIPVEASRLTACHNQYMVDAVSEEVPDSEPMHIPMMAARSTVDGVELRTLRTRLGIAEGDLVVGSFGLLTPEKRIETVARAVARAAAVLPRLRLLLVGPVPDRPALDRQLARLGVLARTIVAGRVPFETLVAHIEIADVVVHLRYPTARETSAALLRVLAQGRPTVISDLEHLSDIPADAVARAAPDDEEGDTLRAILRLAEDAGRRERLGRRAAAFVADAHSPFRCRDGYRAAIEEAQRRSLPERRAWPAHCR
jgi:glycosyltransferase involved in cell wall biosynthesis